MLKPALPGQTSDMSNIRKTKKFCNYPKSSFSRANIRYVKHPKNQKWLQLSENQLYHGKHPICQSSEKPKVLQISEMQLYQGKHALFQTSEKPKMLQTCENQLYEGKHPICQTIKIQKVLQTSEKQLLQGKHPICQTSVKTKSAANIRKDAFPEQTSDVSNIRKTKMWCKLAKTSFTRANIRYVKHPKNQKVLQLSENQLYHGKNPIFQTSERPKSAANFQKAAFPGQTSDMSDI